MGSRRLTLLGFACALTAREKIQQQALQDRAAQLSSGMLIKNRYGTVRKPAKRLAPNHTKRDKTKAGRKRKTVSSDHDEEEDDDDDDEDDDDDDEDNGDQEDDGDQQDDDDGDSDVVMVISSNSSSASSSSSLTKSRKEHKRNGKGEDNHKHKKGRREPADEDADQDESGSDSKPAKRKKIALPYKFPNHSHGVGYLAAVKELTGTTTLLPQMKSALECIFSYQGSFEGFEYVDSTTLKCAICAVEFASGKNSLMTSIKKHVGVDASKATSHYKKTKSMVPLWEDAAKCLHYQKLLQRREWAANKQKFFRFSGDLNQQASASSSSSAAVVTEEAAAHKRLESERLHFLSTYIGANFPFGALNDPNVRGLFKCDDLTGKVCICGGFVVEKAHVCGLRTIV